MTLRDNILRYFQLVPGATAEMVSLDLTAMGNRAATVREVQAAMIVMDDDGILRMRNGWYCLTEAAKARVWA